MSKKIYVISNSHMDPIWVWRFREGRSTWLNTCRTVVRMMRKYPFLKFSRSSSACYRWVEACDPSLFREIRKLVEAGRWEPVGGWVEQSDTIITSGEAFLRQAEHGKGYFLEKFGVDVRTAYCVDSFGQNIGLPKILRASGFDNYVWMRPMQHEKEMPHLFRWRCDDHSGDILCCRIRHAYTTPPAVCTSFEKFEEWFDLATAGEDAHQTFFFGMGDHGGGVYENQLQWLLKLGEKHDIVFSTLAEYFEVVGKEKLPVVEGEHVHHAPGCYAAMGAVKQWMADAEKSLGKAEKILLQGNFQDGRRQMACLQEAWENLLFNYFHDVYSGTCIRAAYENEVRNICAFATKCATDVLERSLMRIGSQVRTDFLTEGGILYWNPLPHNTIGRTALATFGDPSFSKGCFNCLRDESGNEIPLQWIRNAVPYMVDCAAFTVEMPPSGLRVFAYGRTEKTYPALGFARQRALLKRLRFEVVEDLNDTWAHGAKSLGRTLGAAQCLGVEEQENGPVVSRLRCRFLWKDSPIQLDLFAWRGIPEVEAVVTTADWREARGTLKLALETKCRRREVVSGQALASITRLADECEQPFQDYVAVGGNGFFAHALHSYDSIGGSCLRLTVLRPVIYAEHKPTPPNGDEGHADMGFQERRLWIFTGAAGDAGSLAAAACRRLWECEHCEITQGEAKGRAWDDWEVRPEILTVSAQRRNADGTAEFHLLNPSAEMVRGTLLLHGRVRKRFEMLPGALRKIVL